MSSEGAKTFISRWAATNASERANSQFFLAELCDLLGVARPEPVPPKGGSISQNGGYLMRR